MTGGCDVLAQMGTGKDVGGNKNDDRKGKKLRIKKIIIRKTTKSTASRVMEGAGHQRLPRRETVR